MMAYMHFSRTIFILYLKANDQHLLPLLSTNDWPNKQLQEKY